MVEEVRGEGMDEHCEMWSGPGVLLLSTPPQRTPGMMTGAITYPQVLMAPSTARPSHPPCTHFPPASAQALPHTCPSP